MQLLNGKMLVQESMLNMTRDLISLGVLFVMLVCMPTWEELDAGEMTLNPLHTHLFSFSVAACLGKDSRLILIDFMTFLLLHALISFCNS
jgi:hypothetical protein